MERKRKNDDTNIRDVSRNRAAILNNRDFLFADNFFLGGKIDNTWIIAATKD
jgi:hypothetical protein